MTGGGPGIMEAANRGAKEVGGRSVGCNIVLPMEQKPNPYLDRWVNLNYFMVRKSLLIKYSYGFIVHAGWVRYAGMNFSRPLHSFKLERSATFPSSFFPKNSTKTSLSYRVHESKGGRSRRKTCSNFSSPTPSTKHQLIKEESIGRYGLKTQTTQAASLVI
jgi:hypothetical protein